MIHLTLYLEDVLTSRVEHLDVQGDTFIYDVIRIAKELFGIEESIGRILLSEFNPEAPSEAKSGKPLDIGSYLKDVHQYRTSLTCSVGILKDKWNYQMIPDDLPVKQNFTNSIVLISGETATTLIRRFFNGLPFPLIPTHQYVLTPEVVYPLHQESGYLYFKNAIGEKCGELVHFIDQIPYHTKDRNAVWVGALFDQIYAGTRSMSGDWNELDPYFAEILETQLTRFVEVCLLAESLPSTISIKLEGFPPELQFFDSMAYSKN